MFICIRVRAHIWKLKIFLSNLLWKTLITYLQTGLNTSIRFIFRIPHYLKQLFWQFFEKNYNCIKYIHKYTVEEILLAWKFVSFSCILKSFLCFRLCDWTREKNLPNWTAILIWNRHKICSVKENLLLICSFSIATLALSVFRSAWNIIGCRYSTGTVFEVFLVYYS